MIKKEALEQRIKSLEATIKWYVSEGSKETAMIYIEYLIEAEEQLEKLTQLEANL